MTVGHAAVKTGDHNALSPKHQLAQGFIGFLPIHRAVKLELNPVRRIDKPESQIGRHQLGGKILAAADQIILVHGFGIQPLFQLFKFGFQIQLDSQLIPDLQIPGSDHLKHAGAVHPILGVGMAQIQKVCDFMVVFIPLACGRDHHHFPGRVTEKNFFHFLVLAGICHG